MKNNNSLIKTGLIEEDGWHCDPACPHLLPSKTVGDVYGKCLLKNVDLDWYDYYIAQCNQVESVEEKQTPENVD